MEIGTPLPEIDLTMTKGQTKNLAGYAGQALVLYFYPKDDTPGCTLEGREFSSLYPAFQELGVEIIGVSKDSIASHEKFCAKGGLVIPLASDSDGRLCQLFGVWGEKNMAGRKTEGILRSTFFFDRLGKLVWAKRNVKAAGHAAEMLARAREVLQN